MLDKTFKLIKISLSVSLFRSGQTGLLSHPKTRLLQVVRKRKLKTSSFRCYSVDH